MAFVSTLNRFIEVRVPFTHHYVQRAGFHYTSVYLTLRSMCPSSIDPAYLEAVRFYTFNTMYLSVDEEVNVALTGDAFCPDVEHLGVLNASSRTFRDNLDLHPRHAHPVFGVSSMPFEDIARSSYEPWGRVTVDYLNDSQFFYLGGTLSMWFHPREFIPILCPGYDDLRRFTVGSGVRTGYLPSVANAAVENDMQWFPLQQLNRVERTALRGILVSILPEGSYISFFGSSIFFDAPWREEVFSSDEDVDDPVGRLPGESLEWGQDDSYDSEYESGTDDDDYTLSDLVRDREEFRDEMRRDLIREANEFAERAPSRPRRLVRSYGDDQLVYIDSWADLPIGSDHPPAA